MVFIYDELQCSSARKQQKLIEAGGITEAQQS